jgi:tRNA U34 2-thiouridine synthase MnmA/TrmU
MFRVKNVSDESCREIQNTHFMYAQKKKESENLAFCEKTCKNMVQREKPQITI